jgi:NAD(P)H-hydrate epimerase
MIPVVFAETVRALDAHMIQNLHIPSLLLMENAAFGVTGAITARFGTDTRVVALCGPGNNGGDGFAAARQLAAKGYGVSVYLMGAADALKGDAAINAAFFGQRIIEIQCEADITAYLSGLRGCVLIDALFGVGLSREVTGLYAAAIEAVNQSGAYVVAVDIASGVEADTGAVLGCAVRADETVTFQCAKPGHLLYPGRELTGRLTVKEIGTSEGFHIGGMAMVDELTLAQRGNDTHKGSFGKLAVVAGSEGYSGAGLMCVGAALRAGAGLVTAGIPACLQAVFSTAIPEAMTFALDDFSGGLSENCVAGLEKLMAGKTVLAAGPGLGTGGGAAAAVKYLLENHDIHKVFDADALNVIAQDMSILQRKTGDIVLTPHLVEFSRLCGVAPEALRRDLIGAAKRFAAEYCVTLVLKGATTVVTDGERVLFVTAGSPGMARGGSGDILTGVIAGLLCGGREGGMDGFEAAIFGAHICGKAGEAAAAALGELSMTAGDTLRYIPEVTKAMTQ